MRITIEIADGQLASVTTEPAGAQADHPEPAGRPVSRPAINAGPAPAIPASETGAVSDRAAGTGDVSAGPAPAELLTGAGRPAAGGAHSAGEAG